MSWYGFSQARFSNVIRKAYCLLVIFSFGPAMAFAEPHDNRLSLSEAVALAIESDAWLKGNVATQRALNAQAIQQGTLDEPWVSLSFSNLPTDTFNLDQERMTQFKVGLSQEFPRGDSLFYSRQTLQRLAAQHPYVRQHRKAQLTSSLSLLWLDAYLAQQSIVLIEDNRDLFEQLPDLAMASYASALAGVQQQDIVQAQVVLTSLQDRLFNLQLTASSKLAEIGQWLPLDQAITRRVCAILPDTALLKPRLYQQPDKLNHIANTVAAHPSLKAIDQQISSALAGVNLAKQSYKSKWQINASYGYRDGDAQGLDRPDLLSVGVKFSLPSTATLHHDQHIRHAKANVEKLKTDKQLQLRKLVAGYRSTKAKLQHISLREQLYQQKLLPQLQQQVDASLSAYTNDTGDFNSVVLARISLLNAQIDHLGITVSEQKTISQLNYYTVSSSATVAASVGENP